jgi:3-phenylpropionate/cinnamic acid dioxygenase small subunit
LSEDRHEIENLLYRYAELIDLGDFEGVAELFAHGAIRAAGTEGGVEGKQAVQALYTKSTRLYEDGTPRTKHVTTNVIIQVAPDRQSAEARSYFSVLQALPDFPLQAIISGRYHDRFERVDGRWRFAERVMMPELMGDLSHHLLIDL